MEIKLAKTIADIEFCKKALMTFRPQLLEATFTSQVARMIEGGFKLGYIANEENTHAAAVIGFRIFEMLRTGTIIYIDDLFTFSEYRGKGHANALLDFVADIARREKIRTVHLDSGYDLHPAHRLYLKSGFFLAAHHFAKTINS